VNERRRLAAVVVCALLGCTPQRSGVTPAPGRGRAAAPGSTPAASGAGACPESAAVPPPPGSVAPGAALEADSAVIESAGKRTTYSVHGYLARSLRVTRTQGSEQRAHCITVAWPPDALSNADQPSSVAERIDLAWLRAIANTLERVPWSHVQTLRRVVIDNRPKEHGIAAYDRQSLLDARDGTTIWLNEHLFLTPNHWAEGNYGSYYAYHTDVEGQVLDDQPADHALFSPVLLHELAHLVMYQRVNPPDDPISTPECARTCADTSCQALSPAEREAGCVSPYCRPFQFPGSTENWAEQYRFYYQSAATRALLAALPTSCFALLEQKNALDGRPLAPAWQRGFPDVPRFEPSRWQSCSGKACKPF
jgi:hypothetical protein